MTIEKHFIDTSVMRPLISSSSAVKNYYSENLSNNLFYCSYVKMEYLRGFIIPAISFYFTLRMPNIKNISDAISLWSQKFQTRELKAILTMFSGLLENHQFDFNELYDKEKACQKIADYIRRIMTIIPKKFKDIGIEKSMCLKSDVEFNFNPIDLDKSLRNYIDIFNLKNKKECNLKLFIGKHQPEIEKIIKGKGLTLTNSNPKGFLEIVDELSSISHYSCRSCSKIGDVIIALISPKDMRMEHTDYSFDFLMNILEKKHFRHPSEQILNK